LDMKLVIDILTPKQVLFFSRLSDELERNGHQVFRTTREYREVLQLLRLKDLGVTVVGKHGGGTLDGKLKAYAKRVLELSQLVERLKPDAAISFSSPEMARVSFGLGIPHFCVNDSPHAEAVARLTIPLSKLLFTPKVIPKREWMRFGIASGNIVQYNALDPWVWLKDFKPDARILDELGLDESRPIITFRTEESFAAYLLGKTSGISTIVPILKRIMKEERDLQIVIVPRYEEQIGALKQVFGREAVVCESVIDAPSLLYHTTIFVGAGGTMSTEAALLGTPTFSCYPGEPTLIEKYLVKRGLIIRERTLQETADRIIDILSMDEAAKKAQVEKARRLVEGFEDPAKVIKEKITRLSQT